MLKIHTRQLKETSKPSLSINLNHSYSQVNTKEEYIYLFYKAPFIYRNTRGENLLQWGRGIHNMVRYKEKQTKNHLTSPK